MKDDENYVKGRGAQILSKNRFLQNEYVQEHFEGLDEAFIENGATQYLEEFPKKLINKVKSPDAGGLLSMNPYQGCEHGCIYCYARNTHEFYGYSAGLDFERKIIVKKNAPDLLKKELQHPKWKVSPIMLSGNTDCYQPIERKLKITRRLLEVLRDYKHPVGIITKNQLVLRDLDILKEMAEQRLAAVNVSLTTLDESLRRKLEPRTASGLNRLKVIRQLSENGVPVNVMVAPIIPSLNSTEIPSILKAAADAGALSAAYTMVRLNGAIGEIFGDWVYKNFPDRADKVLDQIKSCHQGQLNDSRFGKRMRGDGKVADAISDLFRISKAKYFKGRSLPPYDLSLFAPPGKQFQLFA